MAAGAHPGSGELTSVTATSARNAWAVGDSSHYSTDRPLVMHWNGTAWKNVPVPPGISYLDSVAATSARNAWAARPDHGRQDADHSLERLRLEVTQPQAPAAQVPWRPLTQSPPN